MRPVAPSRFIEREQIYHYLNWKLNYQWSEWEYEKGRYVDLDWVSYNMPDLLEILDHYRAYGWEIRWNVNQPYEKRWVTFYKPKEISYVRRIYQRILRRIQMAF